MKLLFVVCCVIAVIGIALFVGCASDESDTDTCMACHSGQTTVGNQILAAGAGYENSGHLLGPRTLAEETIATNTGHMFVFHGSNAMYSNGDTCQKCHTHQGFVEFVTTGSNAADFIPAASPPGCFSCHEPHEVGDLSLITTEAVTLVDGTTTFDHGDGNLCAACHQALTLVDEIVTGTFPKTIRSYEGPHHGPQADVIMGANYWDSGETMEGVSVHSTADPDGPQDSCVNCHHYLSTFDRQAANSEMGGHGFYMSAEVHGSPKDLGDACLLCHDGDFGVDFSGHANDFEDNTIPAFDWDGNSVTENYLLEIKGMRDTLIGYFGDGATNFGGAGDGPIEDAGTGLDYTVTGVSDERHRDWETAEATFDEAEAESWWNFLLFIEDKSNGVHNPTFAAQLLWDAIVNLNAAGASLPYGDDVGVSRP